MKIVTDKMIDTIDLNIVNLSTNVWRKLIGLSPGYDGINYGGSVDGDLLMFHQMREILLEVKKQQDSVEWLRGFFPDASEEKLLSMLSRAKVLREDIAAWSLAQEEREKS